jgi:polygalacturonase
MVIGNGVVRHVVRRVPTATAARVTLKAREAALLLLLLLSSQCCCCVVVSAAAAAAAVAATNNVVAPTLPPAIVGRAEKRQSPCATALNSACPRKSLITVTECDGCVGNHQAVLRRAGCGSAEVQRWCAIARSATDCVITSKTFAGGAVADNKTVATVQIQAAIDRCHAAHPGGARVIVPRGAFKTGSLMLRSNIELHVSDYIRHLLMRNMFLCYLF